jgi:GMP synthase (glutamine-hydrolysing)
VFVDTGLMRLNEGEQVVETFQRHQGIELIHVRPPTATSRSSPGHRARGQAQGHRRAVHPHLRGRVGRHRGRPFLVQGTLYPDVIESGTTARAKIKSHHNVGGLPEDMTFDLVEPLRALFKDEVRKVGTELGLPDEIVWRQPFPGPGLGVRIIGEVTPDKVAMLQRADAIVREEIRKPPASSARSGRPSPCLPDIRSGGRDGRRAHLRLPRHHPGRHVSEDAMTADWARLPYDLLERCRTAHHQRGRRRQPGGLRRHVEAAGHHRVGVTATSPPAGGAGPGRRRVPTTPSWASSSTASPSSTPGWPWRPAVGPPRWRGPTWPTPAVRCRT